MASPPKLTENAANPLGSDELAADQAASPQTTDPLDKPDGTARPATDSPLYDAEADAVDAALTRLPPG